MAQRRGFGAGIGAGLEVAGQTLATSASRAGARQHQARLAAQQMIDEIGAKVASGEIEPEQAEAQLRATGIIVPPGHFERVRPSMERRLAQALEPTLGAKSLTDVQSPESYNLVRPRGTEPIIESNIPPRFRTDPYDPLAGSSYADPRTEQAARTIGARRRQFVQAEEPKAEKTFGSSAAGTEAPGFGATFNVPRRFNPVTQQFEEWPATQETASYAEAGRGAGITEREKILTPGLTEAQIAQANKVERGTRGEKVRTAGAASAATTTARLNVEFSPKFVSARLKQAVETEVAKARAVGSVEMEAKARESANAVAQLRPFMTSVVGIAEELNAERFGPVARGKGMIQRGANILGMEPTVRRLNTEIARYLRPLAVAFGAREANVSDRDIEIVREAIGITPGMTREETFNALIDLRTRLIIAPIIANKLDPEAGLGDRLNAAGELAKLTLAAEDAARTQRKRFFIDPVTGGKFEVIY